MSQICSKCKAPSSRQIGRARLCETHYREWLLERCEAEVSAGRFGFAQCQNKATQEKDGHRVCYIHAHARGIMLYVKRGPAPGAPGGA